MTTLLSPPDGSGVSDRPVRRFFAIAVMIWGTGCADANSSSPDADTASAPPDYRITDTDPVSAGCGMAPPPEGKSVVAVPGQGDRRYLLDLPDGYDPSIPYPLFFGFHGLGTDGANFAIYFNGSSAAAEAVMVYPDGRDRGVGTEWLFTGGANEDLLFFDVMLRALDDALCIDRGRVFVAGHSAGGFFSNYLTCRRGDRIRGLASVAGGGPLASECVGTAAVWIAHNRDDGIVPFNYAEQSRDFWRDRNGCRSRFAEAAVCVDYEGCDPLNPVTFCPHEESEHPHGWPSFASDAIWRFFEALP